MRCSAPVILLALAWLDCPAQTPSAPDPAVAAPLDAKTPPVRQDVFSAREIGLDIPRVPAIRAVRHTLEASPQIQLQNREVEQRIGGVIVTAAPFDTRVVGKGSVRGTREDRDSHLRDTPPANPNRPAASSQDNLVRRDWLYEWEAGIVKKFRNGITIEPATNFRFAGVNNGDDSFENRYDLGFNFGVTIPLARGLGTTVNEAPMVAARFDWKASLFSLRNVTAQSVLTTMAAYWQCRAAERRYRLLLESEEISTRLAGMADAMVRAQELAGSQLAQIRADQESTTAQRVQSEQGLLDARQRLALAMGYGPDQLPVAPLPADPLPEPPADPKFPSLLELTSAALALRDDLRAAEMLEKSRKVLVTASFLNLRPIVDLRLSAGYQPFELRSQPAIDRGGEWRGSVGLAVDWPIENSAARGTLIQDLAVYAQSQINRDDLARNIVSAVISTFAELRSSAAQFVHLREASRLNREALAAQEELFTLGQATLTDVITARQRLVQAELDYLSAGERYAISVIRLRYETGTLLPWDETGNWIHPLLWSSIPFIHPIRGSK